MRPLLFFMVMLIACPVWADPLEMSPSEAWERARDGEVTIVDVRLPAEWQQTGLPDPAMGVSLQDETLRPRPGFVDDLLSSLGGDRDRPIALICASGNRSGLAQRQLAALGFTAVYNVRGGMLGGESDPGWIARGLPTKPCAGC